jgi:hypothetical protein
MPETLTVGNLQEISGAEFEGRLASLKGYLGL